jgi:hypothetical protein
MSKASAELDRHTIAITTMAPVPTVALDLERFENIQRRGGTWEKDEKLENILKKAAAVPLIFSVSLSLQNTDGERGAGKNVPKQAVPDSWHNHLDSKRGLLGRLTIDDVRNLRNGSTTRKNAVQLLVMVESDHNKDAAFIDSASKLKRWYKDYPAEISFNSTRCRQIPCQLQEINIGRQFITVSNQGHRGKHILLDNKQITFEEIISNKVKLFGSFGESVFMK